MTQGEDRAEGAQEAAPHGGEGGSAKRRAAHAKPQAKAALTQDRDEAKAGAAPTQSEPKRGKAKREGTGSPASPAPCVSVVVPVYNAERFLGQCLDSLLGQTLSDIELICVDDGSTDGTPAMLASYAKRDARVRVITQDNAGPARARNVGMDEARGEFLYFFDCDDWCEPALLERAVARARQTEADIVGLPHFMFDQRVGVPIPAYWALLRDKFPADVSSWRDNPDWLFRAFQNLPWNKLFRTAFVRENGLRFQEDVRLTEDLMFSAPALVRAKRLAFLDDMLVYHREGTGANTMAAKDKHPLDFVAAFYSLRVWLRNEGVYDDLRVAYVNWAIDGFIYNLHTLNTFEGFKEVLRELVQGGAIEGLDLLSLPAEKLHEERFVEFLRDAQLPAEEFAYKLYVQAREDRDERGNRLAVEYYANEDQQRRVEEAERAADEARRRAEAAEEEARVCRERLTATEAELARTREEFDAQMNAAEQKVGRVLCWIPRRIQEAVLARRAAKELPDASAGSNGSTGSTGMAGGSGRADDADPSVESAEDAPVVVREKGSK